jgi:glycosyltransferase involved in cell wall biosynthesis
MRSIAVIIPCYNESQSIASVVEDFRSVLPAARIVVIDNASTDETAHVARMSGAEVILEPRRGKGNAVRRAFADVDADAYVMADGDGTYAAAAAPAMVALLFEQGIDMVIGVRDHAGQEGAYRRGHVMGNRVLSQTFERLFDFQMSDTLSGYRVMSRRFVKSFVFGRSGFEIEAELNVHAALLGANYAEVVTTYGTRHEDSPSKLRTYHDGVRILRRQLRLFRDLKPAKAFALLAIPWFVAALALITPPVIGYVETGLVAKFPSLIAGVGCLLVGVQVTISGLILDRVALGRLDAIRLRYLSAGIG